MYKPHKIRLERISRWKEIEERNFSIFYTGNVLEIKENIQSTSNRNLSSDVIKKTLLAAKGHFAVIIETPNKIIAAVDIARTTPLFYTTNSNFTISNSARWLKREFGLTGVDDRSLLEFAMSGYVTGRKTIYSEIKQLQAGEYLIYDKVSEKMTLDRYYLYEPAPAQEKNKEEYLNELGRTTDNVFKRVVEYAGGRQIVVPLSGGLDSRLIITKLHSMNYPNLFTFSYGPPGNPEALKAMNIARQLGVDWHFVDTKKKKAKSIFREEERQAYWRYADGLSSLPVMNDYYSIKYLLDTSKIDSDAVIINGQSGDFISGNHIPFKDPKGPVTSERLINEIIKKHFSVWQHKKTSSNLQYLSNLIRTRLNLTDEVLTAEKAAALFELWEWQERQSKLVVNGQRMYEYFGLDWQLPLWAPEYVKFWETVPLEYRINQSLFKEYLQLFNYKNLFLDLRQPRSQNWSGWFGLALKTAVKLSTVLNVNPSGMLRYACYYSHYSDQYALYGLNYFLKNIRNAEAPPPGRGILALGTKKWLQENDLFKYFHRND